MIMSPYDIAKADSWDHETALRYCVDLLEAITT